MNNWFLVDGSYLYFTGNHKSDKFRFKFILNGRVNDGYLRWEGFYCIFYFTGSIQRYLNTDLFPVNDVGLGYHPSFIYGINSISADANDVILEFMKSANIRLICTRVIDE